MDAPTPAVRERLAFAAEELAEACQMIGKSLRHGLDSSHRDYGNVSNADLLASELGHVLAAIDLLIANADVSHARVAMARIEKIAKVKRGTHFHFSHIVPGSK